MAVSSSPQPTAFFGINKSFYQTCSNELSKLQHTTSQIAQSTFNTIYCVYDFIRPKNVLNGKREFWIMPMWMERFLGKLLYPFVCASFGHQALNQKKIASVIQAFNQLSTIAKTYPGYNFDYEIKVLQSHIPNAAAIAGGHFIITTALIDRFEEMLEKIKNDTTGKYDRFKTLTLSDLIIFTLGHEFSHFLGGHARKSIENLFLIQIFLILFRIFLNSSSTDQNHNDRSYHPVFKVLLNLFRQIQKIDFICQKIFKPLSEIVIDLYQLTLSRHNEYEADYYGTHLTYDAKGDVRAAEVVTLAFKEMSIDFHPSLSFLNHIKEWFLTHPLPEKRCQQNHQTAEDIYKQKGHYKKP